MREKEPATDTAVLQGSQLVRKGRADVFRQRERTRMKKVIRAAVVVGLIDFGLYQLWLSGVRIGLPSFGPEAIFFFRVCRSATLMLPM